MTLKKVVVWVRKIVCVVNLFREGLIYVFYALKIHTICILRRPLPLLLRSFIKRRRVNHKEFESLLDSAGV